MNALRHRKFITLTGTTFFVARRTFCAPRRHVASVRSWSPVRTSIDISSILPGCGASPAGIHLGADPTGYVEITDPIQTIAGGATTTLISTATGDPSPTNANGASNAALFGSYMAALFASAEGGINAQTADGAGNQAVLAHPHTG